MGHGGLVDELIVIDSGSTDDTETVATAEGATVHRAHDVLSDHNIAEGGKGDALWKSLAICNGDIVLWVDADTRNFDEHFVIGLLHPLLIEQDVKLVKGFYERPLEKDPSSTAGGARITELVVRPLLNLFYPVLTGIVQPLAGEYGGYKEALVKLPFFTGYGVEIGLLIDFVERFGLDALAQVDLGKRVHRNRSTLELGQSAFQVIHVMLTRFEEAGKVKLPYPLPETLTQFWPGPEGHSVRTKSLRVMERPPLAEIV